MSLINLNKFLLLEHSEAHPHGVWGSATTLGSSETHTLGLGLILSW